MAEFVLLLLALANAVAISFGIAVVRAAGRWPRLVSGLIGAVAVIGLGLVRYGSAVAAENYEAGLPWYQVGLLAVFVSCPAWGLIRPARHRSGNHLGPANLGAWVNLIGGYLFACWALAAVVSGIVFVFAAPTGSLR